MPPKLEAPVLRVPYESHVPSARSPRAPGSGLPVHEAVPRGRRGADDDGSHRHRHGGRKRERRHTPGVEAGEQDERAAEDRGAHRHAARRAEERRRPTGPREQHEGGPRPPPAAATSSVKPSAKTKMPDQRELIIAACTRGSNGRWVP